MTETVTIDIQHFELYEPTGRNLFVLSGEMMALYFLMVFDDYRNLVTIMLLLSFEVWRPGMQSAISHCSSNHDTELLRYRQLVLYPDSGHMKYQTKLHKGLVPRQLHYVGKVIQVRNEEMFVYDSKLKKKKLNIPVIGKEHSCSFIFSALK